MDPDQLLNDIRKAAHVWWTTETGSEISEDAARELAERFAHLDDWLMNGGFLPTDWKA